MVAIPHRFWPGQRDGHKWCKDCGAREDAPIHDLDTTVDSLAEIDQRSRDFDSSALFRR